MIQILIKILIVILIFTSGYYARKVFELIVFSKVNTEIKDLIDIASAMIDEHENPEAVNKAICKNEGRMEIFFNIMNKLS